MGHPAVEPSAGTAVALACGLLGRRTPAWTEPTLRVVDRLIAGHSAGWPAGATTGQLAARPDTPALLVALGVRSLLSPHDRWNEPFELGGDGHTPATHTELATAAAAAPTTDATVGLGLWLHDRRHGTTLHDAFTPHGPQSSEGPLATAVLLAGPAPDAARARFDTFAAQVGIDDPTELAAGLLLARELAAVEQAERLLALLEQAYEAHLDEATGAFSRRPRADAPALPDAAVALLAAADTTTPGQLVASVTAPAPPQPQLLDVDFPAFGLRRAEWHQGFLQLRFDPLVEDRAGRSTFRLVGAEPRVWWVSGIDNVTIDLSVAEATVRVPTVRCAVEFAPSSY